MLSRNDNQKWFINTLVFIRPVLLLYLGYVATNLADGFTLDDLIPNTFLWGAIVLYLVNILTDYLRKLDASNTVDLKLLDSSNTSDNPSFKETPVTPPKDK